MVRAEPVQFLKGGGKKRQTDHPTFDLDPSGYDLSPAHQRALETLLLWRVSSPDILYRYDASHEGQAQMHAALDDPATRCLVCLYGRRAGKTHGARFESIYQALQPPDAFGAPLVYVVSDTYAHSKKLFRVAVSELTGKLAPLVDRVSLSELAIRLKTGAEIHVKTADNPASLAGDGVSFTVIDESGFVPDYAIEVLMPALSERQGKVLALGTHDHPNWYRDWFYAGLAAEEGVRSLQLPTSINPHFPKEELDRLQRTTPERVWKKYFEAQFVDDQGALFKRDLIDRRLCLQPQPPRAGHSYVAGVDLARSVDWTVVSIMDTTTQPTQQVCLERWQGTSWEHTTERVAHLLSRYDATALVSMPVAWVTLSWKALAWRYAYAHDEGLGYRGQYWKGRKPPAELDERGFLEMLVTDDQIGPASAREVEAAFAKVFRGHACWSDLGFTRTTWPL